MAPSVPVEVLSGGAPREERERLKTKENKKEDGEREERRRLVEALMARRGVLEREVGELKRRREEMEEEQRVGGVESGDVEALM